MAHRADGVSTYSGRLPNLALGKIGQLGQNLRACGDQLRPAASGETRYTNYA